MTCVIPEWAKEVMESYQGDEEVQEMIKGLVLTPGSLQDYSYQDGIVRYKGRVVVGKEGGIRRKIIIAIHDSQLGGHSGVQVNYLRAKRLFHWPECTRKSKLQYCSVILVESARMSIMLILVSCNPYPHLSTPEAMSP
ncbi:uncharacterized protein [Coffea arabica]|uniref:Integrase zinc-binding domain-containing protein n=1 Tax=Coffea arabica TaxID=13443 RepID=A0ABM4WB75_COFAR